jgi:hypothetical protein
VTRAEPAAPSTKRSPSSTPKSAPSRSPGEPPIFAGQLEGRPDVHADPSVPASTACCPRPRPRVAAVKVAFGDGCEVRGRSFTGSFTASYTRPNRELLVTVNMQELASEGTTLSGATRVMWGVDSTLRLVGELRLDVAGPDTQAPGRQIEIQSDRIQRVHQGVRQVDGWQRWQTLMGKWQAELGGWEQVPSALLPARGLTLVDTPFEHDVVVDHREVGDGSIEVRVNGGRADRVFMVAADGTITDLGED